MLPSNIDLTEHSDFGMRSTFDSWLIPFQIPNEPDDFFSSNEDEWMTSERYDELCRLERFFGRRKHPNKKSEVFGWNDDKIFWERRKHHCVRCGTVVRFPWKIHNGLCEKCEQEMMFDDSYGFPMAKTSLFKKGDEMRGIRPEDLFSLR